MPGPSFAFHAKSAAPSSTPWQRRGRKGPLFIAVMITVAVLASLAFFEAAFIRHRDKVLGGSGGAMTIRGEKRHHTIKPRPSSRLDDHHRHQVTRRRPISVPNDSPQPRRPAPNQRMTTMPLCPLLQRDAKAVLSSSAPARQQQPRHPNFPNGRPVSALNVQLFTSKFNRRQRKVVRMIRDAWSAYSRHAFGHDELMPLSHRGADWESERTQPADGASAAADAAPPPHQSPFHSSAAPRSAAAALGVTVFDALDTLYLGGLETEFHEAVAFVCGNHTMALDRLVPVFETTIRVLGGLLSAYELSGQTCLLDKAYDLGERLLGAWCKEVEETNGGDGGGHQEEHGSNHMQSSATTTTTIRWDILPVPQANVHLKTRRGQHPAWLHETTSLSEATSMLLEFAVLSDLTGDERFRNTAEATVRNILTLAESAAAVPSMVFPGYVSLKEGRPIIEEGTVYSYGSRTDSFYEYLCKYGRYVTKRRRGRDSAVGRSGGRGNNDEADDDNWAADACLRTLRGASESLATYFHCDGSSAPIDWSQPQEQPVAECAMISEAKFDAASREWRRTFETEHLSCFVVGPLLIAASDSDGGGLTPGSRKEDVQELRQERQALHSLAVSLGKGCANMASTTATGLAPERSVLRTEGRFIVSHLEPSPESPSYQLRPEVLEALFYLKQMDVAQSDAFADDAWKIIEAIDDVCATGTRDDEHGAALSDGFFGWGDVGRRVAPRGANGDGDGGPGQQHSYLQRASPMRIDLMPSYFLAETLKYALLGQSTVAGGESRQMLPLSEWVFNTEGHPFRFP